MTALHIPPWVLEVVARLKGAGYAGYLVGGCVRDAMLGREPKDYDVATSARPDEVLALFERAIPVGAAFGTVLVMPDDSQVEGVHVTTLRCDFEYTDGRRPTGVRFTDSVEEDLARRDFTVNALAWDPETDEVIDPFGGREDLASEVIRAVGDPFERFREDALRALRAVRFATDLEFDIDPSTWRAIEVEAKGVERLSAERIRDELLKILSAPDVGRGLWMMVELSLFFVVLPELRGADRMLQAKRGAPTLLDHLIQTAANCPEDPVLRLAGLLHDMGKLETRRVEPDGRVHFHGHGEVGARMARDVCRRLRMPRNDTERVVTLVDMHMAIGGTLGKKALRRWVGRYSEAWVRDLIALGRADWGASGWRGEMPDLDRHERDLEELLAEEDAFRLGDLAVNGHDVMRELECAPGPAVGRVLERLYEMLLDDPTANDRERLLDLIRSKGPAWIRER